jgi:TolB-like protein
MMQSVASPPAPDAAPTASRLRLSLLGPFSLTGPAGGAIAIASKKNRALLAILALAPGLTASRERLASLLWSDRGAEQGRSSLRQSLAVLRKELGPEWAAAIRTHDDTVALEASQLDVDALDLLGLPDQAGLASLRRAVRLYRGPLLDDLAIRDEAFADWLAAERARLQAAAMRLLDRLIPLESGPARIEAAARLVALDDLREASHRALMQAYADQGETALAVRQYEICRKLLKAELGVEPAAETRDLKQRVAAGTAPAAPAPPPAQAAVPGASAPRPSSIAVLPFAMLSSDQEQRYLADGLTEDLITDLSRVPGLFVIAAQTMLKYRNSGAEPADAARELGVRFIVHATMRQLAGGLRLNTQLIDTQSSGVLWADRIDRPLPVIHELQSELAANIAAALVGPSRAPPDTGRYKSPSPEAFDLVMRGRSEWRHSEEAGTRARPLFERAIELDPNYAEAYRWLAETEAVEWLFHGAPEQPHRARALAYARKAVAADPADAAVLGSLAWILLYERRWAESAASFDAALRLNPNDAEAWINFSELHVMEGRPVEGVKAARRALELNPRPYPLYYWVLGSALFAAGDDDAAVRVLSREETYRSQSRRILAAALAMSGRIDEAQNEARLFLAANPHFTIARWIDVMPFRDAATCNRFVEGYRRAGLP